MYRNKQIKQLQEAAWRILPLLFSLMLAQTLWASPSTSEITGLRGSALKLYSTNDNSKPELEIPSSQLTLPIKIEQNVEGGWLKISYQGKKYLVRKYRVKTNKIYNIHKQACNNKRDTHGSVRGMDGEC